MMPATAEMISIAAIRAHLAWMTRRWPELGEPAWLELRALGEGLNPHIGRWRGDAAGLDEAAEWAAGMNKLRGRNIYPVVNPLRDTRGRDATDADVIASIFHWADADSADATARLKSWGGPKWRGVVRTGSIPHDRVHVYWELREWQRDLAAWRGTQQAIARQFGSDGAVINPSRIMRLAGTISWPAERKVARGYVSELAMLRSFDDREMVETASFARAFGGEPAAPATGFAFDTTQPESLDRQKAATAALSGEEWHNNIIRLVASYVAKGLSDGEIHAITDGMTLTGYSVEQTRREVQTAIDGARAKGWAPPPQEYATPDAAWGDTEAPAEPAALEWFDDIEPALADSYIVKGVLQQGALSVLYGASNTGKTFFALDMAFCIATGTPWRGMRVNGGGVLYLAAEGGRGAVNRLAALRLETGCCDVPLALKRAGLDLLRSNADLRTVVTLARAVSEKAPLRLIVIDTLSRVMAGGDENAPQDMTALIRNIDAIRAATGAHVMLVHHSGKDEARGARGHSSLRAAVDTEIEVVNDDNGRAAFVRKQRDYEGGQVWAFSLKPVLLGTDQDGDEVASCVVESADSEEFLTARTLRKGLGGAQQIIAETFDQMLSEGVATPNPGGVGMPAAGTFWCVPAAELRRLSMAKMTTGNPRNSFNVAFTALSSKRGLFCSGENVVWAVDRKIKE